MKKTLTAALALSTFAGLALATSTIETPKAGCISVDASSSMFVINPFAPFEGSTLTLGDIDGSAAPNGFLRVYTANGKKAFDAKWNNGAWCEWSDSQYGASSNDYPLARGASVMFVNDSASETLTVAGVLSESNQTVTCVRGQNFVGNIAPIAKNLTTFTVGGSFDPWSDYVATADGTKYVYYGGNWYLRSDYIGTAATINPVTSVTINAGEGFRVYTPSGAGVTISLPAL